MLQKSRISYHGIRIEISRPKINYSLLKLMEDLNMTFMTLKTKPGYCGYNSTGNIPTNQAEVRIAANIIKTEDYYKIDLLAPGRVKDKFSISLDKSVLEISYNQEENNQNAENAELIYSEFRVRGFSRRFYVPETVDREKISARYENGILSINVPYENPEKNRVTKTITVN